MSKIFDNSPQDSSEDFNDNPLFYISVAFVIVLLFGFILYYVNKDVIKDVAEGNQLPNNERNYESRLKYLESEYKAKPEDSKILREYATELYASGDVLGAKDIYEKELNLNSQDAILYNNLGNAYRDLKEYTRAEEMYRKSISLDTKQLNAYNNLANMYIYSLSDFQSGISVLDLGVKSNSEYKEQFLILMASTYEQNQDLDRAEEIYKQLLAINSNNEVAKNGIDRIIKNKQD